MEEIIIGKITHYFPKIGVGVAQLTDGALTVGDKIRIKGNGCDFEQSVLSLQVDHAEVPVANIGQSVGMKVDSPVKPGAKIFKCQ